MVSVRPPILTPLASLLRLYVFFDFLLVVRWQSKILKTVGSFFFVCLFFLFFCCFLFFCFLVVFYFVIFLVNYHEVWSSGQDLGTCLHRKISENFMRLILLDGFYNYWYYYFKCVLYTSVNWWALTRVWVTVSLFKYPEPFSVFWPILINLTFGWSRFVLRF